MSPSVDGSRYFVLKMMWMMTRLWDCGIEGMNRAFSAWVVIAGYPGALPHKHIPKELGSLGAVSEVAVVSWGVAQQSSGATDLDASPGR